MLHRSLSLATLRIHDPLPSGLGTLAALKVFDVSDNFLRGTFPAFVQFMTALT